MSADELTFRSKVDTWIPIVVLLSLLVGPAMLILAPGKRPVTPETWKILIGVSLFAVALLGWMFATTEYVISGSELRLASGPVRMVVPIDQITRISRGSVVGAAVALSLSRIEIQYGRFRSIMISPEDPREFIRAILSRAPRVAIEDLDEYR